MKFELNRIKFYQPFRSDYTQQKTRWICKKFGGVDTPFESILNILNNTLIPFY